MGYIFSVPINSSSIISIDYNIWRSSRALKRPQSITQGRLVFIFCLINTNKTVQQDGPSTFQGSKWFCMYFMRKFNSSWYRIPRGKYMAGLSGLFRSPGRKVNTNLNTSLLRVIYISTTQGLGCSTDCVCGSLTSALETQGSSSVACYSIHLQTSHTAEMLPTHCQEATQRNFGPSVPFTHRGSLRPVAGTFSFRITQVLFSIFALQQSGFLKGIPRRLQE